MTKILTREEIGDAQTLVAKWVKFVDLNSRPRGVPLDGFTPLGVYNGRKDYFACFKEDRITRIEDERTKEETHENVLDFYLNRMEKKQRGKGKKCSILANITGVVRGDHFIVQYSRKSSDKPLLGFDRPLIVHDFIYLASLYCAVERFLRNETDYFRTNHRTRHIVFPPFRIYGQLLDENGNKNPQYAHKHRISTGLKNNNDRTASLENQYRILTFGSKEPNFKRRYHYLKAGEGTNGKLLEDHLRSLK